MYADADSEEITQLEELLDTRMNEWAEQWAKDFEDSVDRWAIQFE